MGRSRLGYTGGSVLLISLLLFLLFLWYKTEKTISVEHIYTTKSELFYWTAFLIANTLGTAAGDFLADELHIGFINSAIIISGILILTALLHYFSKINSILLFWIAFVFTRPFGATFGDFLTKTHDKGGIGIGTIGASIFFTVILIVAMIREMQVERKKEITL